MTASDLHFTPEGLARVTGASDGPVFMTSAVLEMSDGREVTVAPGDTPPASGGRTTVTLAGPPGGGHVRRVRLLAEDGVAIIAGHIEVVMADGNSLHLNVALA